MKKRLVVIIMLLFVALYTQARPFSLSNASLDSLNHTRINTNKTGMEALSAWGIANVLAGTAGYFIATDKEAKAFHGMNAIWGVTNALIATAGFAGARKELSQTMTCDQMLSRYEANKRLFLINGALDVVYIGTGTLLNAYADNTNNPTTWHGFGKSIAMQGIFLLLFDGTMYSLHQKQNKKWYTLIQGICFTGNGLGLRYNL